MNENGFSLFANPFTADIDNSPTWIDRHSKQSDFKNTFIICMYEEKNSQNYGVMQRM